MIHENYRWLDVFEGFNRESTVRPELQPAELRRYLARVILP